MEQDVMHGLEVTRKQVGTRGKRGNQLWDESDVE